MPLRLYDAHNHRADASLVPHEDVIESALVEIGLRRYVVNGTHPGDWPGVLEFARTHPAAIPAVGLHPWRVQSAPEDWRTRFSEALENGAHAIGEIGLDQWIKAPDRARQQTAFQWQLTKATERNLPVSIHCLKAIGPMMETLRCTRLPDRGIHMHAYSGPIELIKELVDLGACFSFNGGQLKKNAKTVRAAIRQVPEDRLLLETDAPNLLPPEPLRSARLPPAEDGLELNHPANLSKTYEAVAELREQSLQSLADQLEKNFVRYFTEGIE